MANSEAAPVGYLREPGLGEFAFGWVCVALGLALLALSLHFLLEGWGDISAVQLLLCLLSFYVGTAACKAGRVLLHDYYHYWAWQAAHPRRARRGNR